jgi:hypothetical protein
MCFRYRLAALLVIAPFATIPAVACAGTIQAADTPRAAKAVTVSDLSREPERFSRQEVKVTGRLTSDGNYFSRNRKIWLTAPSGERVEVTLWLPLSSPPPRSESAPGIPTLADYLDQNVELQGVFRRMEAAPGAAPKSGAGFVLDVKSAKILRP